MKSSISHPQDFWSGVLFIAIAVLFAVSGWRLDTGQPSQIGPGYFPRGVAVVLGLIGVTLCVRALLRKGQPLGFWGVRGIVTVLGAIVVFGLSIREMGLICSGLAAMFVSFLGSPDASWVETMVVSVIVVIACTLLFVGGIGLTIPIWPRFVG
jgi:putative tricarboxylic transport membrane protein